MNRSLLVIFFFFFFNDTATTEIYTLSLHDALPISVSSRRRVASDALRAWPSGRLRSKMTFGCLPVTSQISATSSAMLRSEEHTSELQSQSNLVCRLLLEKKKTTVNPLLFVRDYCSH